MNEDRSNPRIDADELTENQLDTVAGGQGSPVPPVPNDPTWKIDPDTGVGSPFGGTQGIKGTEDNTNPQIPHNRPSTS